MIDRETEKPEQTLLHAMGISPEEVARRQRVVALTEADVRRVVALKDLVTRNADRFTSHFFEYLSGLEEARALFASREQLERARRFKHEHLLQMVSGDYGLPYVVQRLSLALLYGKVGLDMKVFLGAFHHLLRAIGDAVMQEFPDDGFERFMSLKKVAFFDIGIIVDVLVYERERVIRQQQEAIRELSTPVLQVRERLLILPIIGIIDTHRARLLTESLLRSIRANRARVVVIDITGVAAVDSKVANHLLQAVAAARLMGATAIVTGLSSDVAQTLVTLGVDLGKLTTIGDLQGGLEEAERLLGYKTVLAQPNGHSTTHSEAT